MTKTLKDLSAFVEREATSQGSNAAGELEMFRGFYRVARLIAERRLELRLTQANLSEISGVRQSEISKIESGKANPTFATLSAIAASLGSEVTFVRRKPRRHGRNGRVRNLLVKTRDRTIRHPRLRSGVSRST